MTSTSEQFIKSKSIIESEFMIPNYQHIIGGVNIYLYGCINLVASECAECLCVPMWCQIR